MAGSQSIRLLEAWEGLRDVGLPPGLRIAQDADAARARLLVTTSALAVGLGLFVMAAQARAGGRLPAMLTGVLVAVAAACPLLLRATGSPRLAGNVLVAAFFVTLGGLGIATRGEAVVTLYWSALLPMLAVLMVGPAAGLVWAALVVVEIGVVFHLSGQTPWVSLSEASLEGSKFRGAIMLSFIALGVVLAYERVRQRSLLELEKARRRAEDASAAKGAFLANMSHEIRTPLNGILGMAQIVADSELGAEQRESIELIQRTGESLLKVINDVLDLSRVEAGKLSIEMAPFEPRACVTGVCVTLSPTAVAKGLTLRAEVAPDVPTWILGDAGRVHQVLLNLVANAVKFTERGGVTVKVTRTAGADGVARLHVRVEDSGIGIPPADQSRVFENFVQVDGSLTRKHGGTGLGLPIARALLTRMGGRIGLESDPGAGSCFWFDLPLQEAGEAPEDGADVEATLAPGLHVLVAEDNAVNRRVAQHMLEKLGCRVTLARDGVEALRAVAAERFDAVLMDCQMPELNGYAATAEIRRREAPGSHLPVIAFTAHAMREDRERCLAAGMDDYVSKPVSLVALRAALARTLGPRSSAA